MVSRLIRANLDPDVDWSEIDEIPETFPPEPHQHDWTAIFNEPTTYPPDPHQHDWNTDVTGKPATFAPSAHTHPWTEVTSKPVTFAPSAHTHPWTDVTGKPTTFPPETHTHPINQITGEIVQNYDPPAGNRPRLIWATSGTGTNSPDGLSGWSVFGVPWGDQNFSYGWQIGAKYNDNPQGMYWRQTKNLTNQPWWRIWDERNLPNPLAETVTAWTPALASDNNITWSYIFRTANYVRHGSLVFVYCSINAIPASGQPLPTGAIRITGFPLAPVASTAGVPVYAQLGNQVKHAHRINLYTSQIIVLQKLTTNSAEIGTIDMPWSDSNNGSINCQFSLVARV